MRRIGRWALRALVFLALVVVAVSWLSLPPRALTLDVSGWHPQSHGVTLRGAYHAHTRRSDGTGTVEDVAAAAGRAGLDFLVLTDHGDATRTPDPPRYVNAVLVIDAVEISTRTGHFAALGLPGPAPYRLAGRASDVAEDVERLGGVGFVTHPDSPKKGLSWRDWSYEVHGFEWLNADSEWRDEDRWSWGRLLLTYPWRPVEAVTALLDRPVRTLERWDEWTKRGRYLVTIAGADAHARLGWRDFEDEDGVEPLALKLPAYESVFRAFSTNVVLDGPASNDAAVDAKRLIAALGSGKSYTSIDGVAGPARFEFFARTRDGVKTMGESVPEGTPVTFVARTVAPSGTQLRLLRNGRPVAESSGLEITFDTTAVIETGESGAGFRVEAVAPSSPGLPPVPWILSNPIFVASSSARTRIATPAGPRAMLAPAPAAGVSSFPPNAVGIDLRGCRSETDSTSTSDVRVNEGGDRLDWAWRLAGSSGPAWVAVACAMAPVPNGDAAIVFSAESDEPIRVSVQLREDAGPRPVVQRWQRTVYVDGHRRAYVVPIASLEAVEKGGPDRVPPGVRTLLLVVDGTHGLPGMKRRVHVESAALLPVAQE